MSTTMITRQQHTKLVAAVPDGFAHYVTIKDRTYHLYPWTSSYEGHAPQWCAKLPYHCVVDGNYVDGKVDAVCGNILELQWQGGDAREHNLLTVQQAIELIGLFDTEYFG